MAAAGLTADPAWTTLTAQALPGAPVTAVLCADRSQTEAVIRAIAEPGRLAVVGFGDFPLADLVSPPVTVLSYDAMADRADGGRTAGPTAGGRAGAAAHGAGAGAADRARLGRVPAAGPVRRGR